MTGTTDRTDMTGLAGRDRPVLRGPVPLPSWSRAAAQLAALELLVVGGTLVVEGSGHRAPDPAGYALLAVAAGAPALSRWSPLSALGIALLAALAYVARGGSEHGPLVLAVMAALYAAVRPEHPWRSVAIGGVTLLGFYAAGAAWAPAGAHAAGAHGGAVTSSPIGEFVASLVNRSWIAVPLVLGHAVASARRERAAAEERARLAEQTREEHAQRRVAEERLRIARELHDVVSHSISVINLQAGVAAHVMDERPEQARQALLAIKATSKEALGELRGILGLLRQGDEGDKSETRAPAPSLDQLGALVEATSRAGVLTRLTVDGPARRLPPAVELAAYRIVQESLANVLRHAGAASAAVTLQYQDDQLTVEITDDGPRRQPAAGGWPAGAPAAGGGNGLSPATGRNGPGIAGLGLVGMRERAAAVGGQLAAGPRPDGGFKVYAWLPAPRSASDTSDTSDTGQRSDVP